MSVNTVWAMLPALASAGLLAFGLLAAQPPRPADGPVPVVAAPAGMSAQFIPGAQPTSDMTGLDARITGRASVGARGYEHQWPAFHASARFSGHSVAVALDDAANRYRITLDDAAIVLTRPGAGMLRIEGLSDGPHRIRLEKLSERSEIGRFDGFFLPAGGTALPTLPAVSLIEFVGDSDTVGYGNTGPGRDCTSEQQYLATDTSQAYGPMTARALGADYRVIAASGIGLVRNLGGGSDPAMAQLYDRALPSRPDAASAPERAADVVVIGLGSNDFAERPEPDQSRRELQQQRDRFAGALLQFMRDRRAHSPSARIVLLAFGEYGDDLIAAHRQARDEFVADGDAADLLVLPELARTACHWHPSLNDHQVISAKLTRLLKATSGLP
jgi:lysophospholipase L1-like esterase